MSKHAMEASLQNIEQNLIELIADYLDSEAVQLDEVIGMFKDRKERHETELHIRMAKEAMKEYRSSIVYYGNAL